MSVEPFKVCARGVQKDGFGPLLPVLLPSLLPPSLLQVLHLQTWYCYCSVFKPRLGLNWTAVSTLMMLVNTSVLVSLGVSVSAEVVKNFTSHWP